MVEYVLKHLVLLSQLVAATQLPGTVLVLL